MEGSTELLLNYGVLGVIAIVAFLFARKTFDRLIEDRDRAEKRTDDVQQIVLTDVAPALRAATEMVQRVAQRDAEIVDVLTDVRRLLERNQ